MTRPARIRSSTNRIANRDRAPARTVTYSITRTVPGTKNVKQYARMTGGAAVAASPYKRWRLVVSPIGERLPRLTFTTMSEETAEQVTARFRARGFDIVSLKEKKR